MEMRVRAPPPRLGPLGRSRLETSSRAALSPSVPFPLDPIDSCLVAFRSERLIRACRLTRFATTCVYRYCPCVASPSIPGRRIPHRRAPRSGVARPAGRSCIRPTSSAPSPGVLDAGSSPTPSVTGANRPQVAPIDDLHDRTGEFSRSPGELPHRPRGERLQPEACLGIIKANRHLFRSFLEARHS
jgi:hypothetical protein